MKGRITVLTLCAMLFALCLPVEAQQPKKVPRIGFLGGASASSYAVRINAFRQGLNQLGYIEGKNIVIEYRYAEGKLDRLPALAKELVGLKPDVIVAAPTPSVLAAKKASAMIPIVFVSVGDPVGSGLVASLARPGGNITGLTVLVPELSGKRLELLKEAIPNVIRVAALWNPANPAQELVWKEIQAAAQELRLQLQSLEVRSANDFDIAFEAALRERAQALIPSPDPLINTQLKRIVEFAAKNRLPAMYGGPEVVDAGGLMSYAPNYTDHYRRTATYVDKILKGTKPADLPVEQPKKFEFIINLKTAKQIGLTIPPNVLARADKVIK
ncbi:MAG TPA: ABC transporter substrate-binding protein [Candidatus Binatia bacterium]|nr:ABC transporter substrate-binding protein [Candidatus Binatia bacterium]